ncbi:C-type mannose receptor 2-like [Chanos chanos]|uniref:C-type mannose receptor 2-like n=1 Tax=Chanos chanos TaxID=29144 RepID=A0A6J2VVP0_CHACN|nr:C-type mannose receptor 2-like [Chanos chanos]
MQMMLQQGQSMSTTRSQCTGSYGFINLNLRPRMTGYKCRVFMLSACVPCLKYHFVKVDKNWTEAQTYCREHYTDLATIDNQEDTDELIKTVNLEADYIWIGLRKPWEWSLSDSNPYALGTMEFTNWDIGEPDNYRNASEKCGMMRTNGKWNDLLCQELHSFVCYDGLFMLSACVNHQYHFVNVDKTWTEAQTYCREHYTDLATIDNQEDTDELIKTVKGDVERVWIGLEKSGDMRWQWSLGDPTFYREGEMEFTNWHPGEPNNLNNHHCTEMRTDGKWNNEPCNQEKMSVCYDERKVSSERYIVINETKTWREAQSYCREHHTDLVSVRNQTENEWIKSSMKDKTEPWIGLFRDSWKWSDQSNSSFRNWAPGQPDNNEGDENCAFMQITGEKQGQWHDFSCDNEKPFVCYEDKLILINESLTWSEALNHCKVNHVDLVSVHSEKIQKWVMEVVEKASTDHVWLGLRYSCTLGFWFWVSGESSCYQNWASGNGTVVEECVNEGRTGAVETRGVKQWISLPENTRLNFICSNYNGFNLTKRRKRGRVIIGHCAIIHVSGQGRGNITLCAAINDCGVLHRHVKNSFSFYISCTITFFNRKGSQGKQSKPNMLLFGIISFTTTIVYNDRITAAAAPIRLSISQAILPLTREQDPEILELEVETQSQLGGGKPTFSSIGPWPQTWRC